MPLDIDMPRPRILIAEDNYLMATEVEEFVRGCGYAVAGAAPSVERGLALIAEGAPDGALLDIDLAGTPSFPMCRALIAKGVPFLFLTRLQPEHDRSRRVQQDAPAHQAVQARRLEVGAADIGRLGARRRPAAA